jgi:hypothetical protein
VAVGTHQEPVYAVFAQSNYAEFQIGTVDGLFQIMHKPAPRCDLLAFDRAAETLSLRVSW